MARTGVADITVVLLDANGSPTMPVDNGRRFTDAMAATASPGLMRAAIIVDFDEADADLAGKVLVTQDVDGNMSATTSTAMPPRPMARRA